MTDSVDQLLDREQVIADNRVATRVVYQGFSAYECESCGNDIPEGRRIAVPGCSECTECATIGERRR